MRAAIHLRNRAVAFGGCPKPARAMLFARHPDAFSSGQRLTIIKARRRYRPHPRRVMPRFRIKIVNVDDRGEQLRLGYKVREDLIEQGRTWLDPEWPLEGVHRDTEGRAYLELAAESREAIDGVLNRNCHGAYTALSETADPLGDGCQRCDNIAGPVQPPVCPNCGFRDIGPCTVCGKLNSRELYTEISGNQFYCPTRQKARLTASAWCLTTR